MPLAAISDLSKRLVLSLRYLRYLLFKIAFSPFLRFAMSDLPKRSPESIGSGKQKDENGKCGFEQKETKVTKEYKTCRPARDLSAWNSHVHVDLGYRSRCHSERSLVAANAWFSPFVTFVSFCSKSHFLLFLDLRCLISRNAVRNQLARGSGKRKIGNAVLNRRKRR